MSVPGPLPGQDRQPSAQVVEGARRAFEYCVANFLYAQAAFFAERLVAEVASDAHLYLLGQAYFHNGEVERARALLENCTAPSARYLYARCCIALGKHGDAVAALQPSRLRNGGYAETPHGAAGTYLLGQALEGISQRAEAIQAYRAALEAEPTLWGAYERLSALALVEGSKQSPAAFAATFFGKPARARLTSRGDTRAASQGARVPTGAAVGNPAAGQLATSGPAATAAVDALLALLCIFGCAVHALASYDTGTCLQQLQLLPRRQYETGGVLAIEARCHFEDGNYAKAAEVYEKCWKRDTHRLEGLEFYSSALWHLRREVELGVLSQRMVAVERRSSQVWCAIGSCFSLQRESEAAVKFFRRAVQVDGSFTYAYTLLAHEYAATDELEKAKTYYEQAVALDPRHYPAWWGLGHLAHRQEEYTTAKYHFKKALEIHRRSSVLLCYLGMVYQALDEKPQALEVYSEAANLDPKNFDAQYKRALVLLELDQKDDGIAALQKLIAVQPKEACLHFHLAKTLAKRDPQQALVHFHRALDLDKDTKDQQMIKQQIESLTNAGPSANPEQRPLEQSPLRTPTTRPASVSDSQPRGGSRVARREPAAPPPRTRPVPPREEGRMPVRLSPPRGPSGGAATVWTPPVRPGRADRPASISP